MQFEYRFSISGATMTGLNPEAPKTSRLPVAQVHSIGVPIVNPIEQELEGAVRLTAKRNFRTEHEEPSLSDLGICHGNRILQIALAPSPPAAQRLIRIKPGNGPNAFRLR